MTWGNDGGSAGGAICFELTGGFGVEQLQPVKDIGRRHLTRQRGTHDQSISRRQRATGDSRGLESDRGQGAARPRPAKKVQDTRDTTYPTEAGRIGACRNVTGSEVLAAVAAVTAAVAGEREGRRIRSR